MPDDERYHDDTRAIHAGRHPDQFEGVVNPPVFHASTVLSSSMAEWEEKKKRRAADIPGTYYGRFGTPTSRSH